jgi:hypothetical protein
MRGLWNTTTKPGLDIIGAVLALLLIWPQCGYRPVGKEGALPDNFTRLAIPLMENQTMEAGVEDLFTSEVRRQFLTDPRVEVVRLADAEVVFEGKIVDLDLIRLSHDEMGRVSGQRVRVGCRFQLIHRASEKILWQSGLLEAEEECPVTDDYLMNERYKEQALAELAEDISETAHELLLSGF